jgi:hypothetical protein
MIPLRLHHVNALVLIPLKKALVGVYKGTRKAKKSNNWV